MNRKRAKELGLRVERSKKAGKKWDAYDAATGEFQASFGAQGYKDYAIFLREDGKAEADKRRAAYKARHAKDRAVRKRDGKFTAGYLADQLLW